MWVLSAVHTDAEDSLRYDMEIEIKRRISHFKPKGVHGQQHATRGRGASETSPFGTPPGPDETALCETRRLSKAAPQEGAFRRDGTCQQESRRVVHAPRLLAGRAAQEGASRRFEPPVGTTSAVCGTCAQQIGGVRRQQVRRNLAKATGIGRGKSDRLARERVALLAQVASAERIGNQLVVTWTQEGSQKHDGACTDSTIPTIREIERIWLAPEVASLNMIMQGERSARREPLHAEPPLEGLLDVSEGWLVRLGRGVYGLVSVMSGWRSTVANELLQEGYDMNFYERCLFSKFAKGSELGVCGDIITRDLFFWSAAGCGRPLYGIFWYRPQRQHGPTAQEHPNWRHGTASKPKIEPRSLAVVMCRKVPWDSKCA